MPPARVAEPVRHLVGARRDGTRQRRPEDAGVLVAHPERLVVRVAHGIVRPRRQTVLAAVAAPGAGGAALADEAADRVVREHVHPRHWRPRARRVEAQPVLTPVGREAAGARRRGPRLPRRELHGTGDRCRGRGALLARERGERPRDAAGCQRAEPRERVGRDRVAPQDVDAVALERGRIVPRIVSNDEQRRRKPQVAPVRHARHQRGQQRAGLRIVGVDDERGPARDQRDLRLRRRPRGHAAGDPQRRRPQRRVTIEQRAGERLQPLGGRVVEAEPRAACALVRSRQSERRRRRVRVGPARRERERGIDLGRRAERRDERGSGARSQLHRAPQREHRIEHVSHGSGEACPGRERARPCQAPAAADEARAVGLVLRRAGTRERVDHPSRAVAGAARPAVGQQRSDRLVPRRLDEELREGRVGGVRGRLVQDHLQAGGELEPARDVRAIPHPHDAQLDVGLGHHRHLERRFDTVVLAGDRQHARAVLHRVARGTAGHGLPAERPDRAAVRIAQVEAEAVRVGDAIARPCGERHVAPPRAAGSGARHQDGEVAVREQARVRRRIVRPAEPLARGLAKAAERHDDPSGGRGRVPQLDVGRAAVHAHVPGVDRRHRRAVHGRCGDRAIEGRREHDPAGRDDEIAGDPRPDDIGSVAAHGEVEDTPVRRQPAHRHAAGARHPRRIEARAHHQCLVGLALVGQHVADGLHEPGAHPGVGHVADEARQVAVEPHHLGPLVPGGRPAAGHQVVEQPERALRARRGARTPPRCAARTASTPRRATALAGAARSPPSSGRRCAGPPPRAGSRARRRARWRCWSRWGRSRPARPSRAGSRCRAAPWCARARRGACRGTGPAARHTWRRARRPRPRRRGWPHP